MRGLIPLFVSSGVRSLAVGGLGILLGQWGLERGIAPERIALFVGAGLAGSLAATLAQMAAGRRLPAKVVLVAAPLLAAAGLWRLVDHPEGFLALAAACLGMLNGMGRDRSIQSAIESAILPSLGPESARTKLFAWYSLVDDLTIGLGTLLPALFSRLPALVPGAGAGLKACAALLAVSALLCLFLPANLAPPQAAPGALRPESRASLAKICALFLVDATAGGFLTGALLSYFFFVRFHASPVAVSALFFAAKLLNALSHLGAAWLAKRIGLVNTMVFTHLPSSLLLMTAAVAPTFPIAALFFLLREGLVEMDVPTRSSYVMAIVAPQERTFAAGATQVVRVGGWALGAFIAGPVIAGAGLAAPLVTGAAMKIVYDLLLWRAFRNLKPPEER